MVGRDIAGARRECGARRDFDTRNDNSARFDGAARHDAAARYDGAGRHDGGARYDAPTSHDNGPFYDGAAPEPDLRHGRFDGDAMPARTAVKPPSPSDGPSVTDAADRFVDDQMFEEDVRAVVALMRPHRRERLMGWAEYRTGGANFRATVSWDPSFAEGPQSGHERRLAVPRLTDVIESILVGSVKDQDTLDPAEEFEIYRGVVRELYRRLEEMQGRYV